MTPTGRTLRLLRDSGFVCDVVERWLPRLEVRRDLFHFGDVLAARPADRLILIVQATSAANVSARVKKALGRHELGAWLKAGGAFEVWGWFQRDGKWDVRRVEVRAADLVPVDLTPHRRPRRARKGERQQSLFKQGD